jgi:hypothetical protein
MIVNAIAVVGWMLVKGMDQGEWERAERGSGSGD